MDRKRRQEISIDGIETSLSMAQIAYSRLLHAAELYSQSSASGRPSFDVRNHVLLDVWSLIDVINRLRVLVQQTTGLTQNEFVTSFLRSTARVEDLRNFVQHLDGETANVADSGWPIWGSLSWVWTTPEMQKEDEFELVLVVPGPLAQSSGYPVVNPAGKEIEVPIDHISLSVVNGIVNLSEVFRACMLFRRRFEAALEQARVLQPRQADGQEETPLRIVLAA